LISYEVKCLLIIDLEKSKCNWYLMKPYKVLINLYFCYSNYFVSIFMNIYDFTRNYDFLVQTLKYTRYSSWMHVCFCFKSFQSISSRTCRMKKLFKLGQNNFEYSSTYMHLRLSKRYFKFKKYFSWIFWILIEQYTKNMSEKLWLGRKTNYTEWFLICMEVWVLTFF
jgi:hypothetical protein